MSASVLAIFGRLVYLRDLRYLHKRHFQGAGRFSIKVNGVENFVRKKIFCDVSAIIQDNRKIFSGSCFLARKLPIALTLNPVNGSGVSVGQITEKSRSSFQYGRDPMGKSINFFGYLFRSMDGYSLLHFI